jgi:hypothetical protein
MSNSDFFKRLYLAAITSGQISATSGAEQASAVMQSLMKHYLDASQNLGRVKRFAKAAAREERPFMAQRGGSLSS